MSEDFKGDSIGNCVCGAAVFYDDGFNQYMVRIGGEESAVHFVDGDEGENIVGDGGADATAYRCPNCHAAIGVYIESDGRYYHLTRQ